MRSSLVLSARDLEFLLHEWLQVEELTKRPRYAEHSRETFDAVLELAAALAHIAARVTAQHADLVGNIARPA